LDVNGDGFVTARDALTVLNQLNGPVVAASAAVSPPPRSAVAASGPTFGAANAADAADAVFARDSDGEYLHTGARIHASDRLGTAIDSEADAAVETRVNYECVDHEDRFKCAETGGIVDR
jgi:hypothetical protein